MNSHLAPQQSFRIASTPLHCTSTSRVSSCAGAGPAGVCQLLPPEGLHECRGCAESSCAAFAFNDFEREETSSSFKFGRSTLALPHSKQPGISLLQIPQNASATTLGPVQSGVSKNIR